MMFAKLSKNSLVKKILVVSLTNVGDVILTCPVIDILRRDFPNAQLDVVVGPRAVSVFEEHLSIRVKVFDKQASLRGKYKWFNDLCQEKYDCVIDLRHTLLSFFLRPRYATSLIRLNQSFKGHLKDKHLNCFKEFYPYESESKESYAIVNTKQDEELFHRLVTPFLDGRPFVVIAPGAADSAKRWNNPEGFAKVADYLSTKYKVVFVGDRKDIALVESIQKYMKTQSLSLAGQTGLQQLAYILKQASWAMTHDSGIMHLAGYVHLPVAALWGPTDTSICWPWQEGSVVIRRNEQCVRCQNPNSQELHNCMSFIQAEDIMKAVEKI